VSEPGISPSSVSDAELPQTEAVGSSFYRLRQRYALFIWLLMLLNCSRHAPLYFLPGRKRREMGRFGIGFIGGIWDGMRRTEGHGYQ
jgi:hypothetical protein